MRRRGLFFEKKRKLQLVFTAFMPFCDSSQLFGKVHVLDGQKAEVYVTVKRSCANGPALGKRSFHDGTPHTGIQRPSVRMEMVVHLGIGKNECVDYRIEKQTP